MRVVKQSVTLEAYTTLGAVAHQDVMRAGLFPGTSEGALAIERAARTCYKSEGLVGQGSAAKIIGKLRNLNHAAMLEFADATFRVVCDRGVSHEFVRHRIMSFAQESTRYCNYSKEKHGEEITVIDPFPSDRYHTAEWIAWHDAVAKAEESYLTMTRAGVAAQIARSVLPTCTKTELVAKANFREWLHFVALRTSPAAHPQMREVACKIRAHLVALCPEVFGG